MTDPIPTFAEIQDRFRAASAAEAGIGPDRFGRPGTRVVPSAEREGTGVVSIHSVGSFTIVWADPGVVGTVRSLESDTAAFPVEGVRDWATDRGAEYLGGAYGHLIGRGMIAPSPVPPGTVLLEIDRDDEGHRALIRDLTAGCDADDIDAAEVEMDDLDPVIVGLIDGGGRLVGMAGERPWRLDPGFGDIGVLVRPDGRRRGHGRAAVAALCRWDFENGRLPLYRCTWDRAASRRLALSVGFRQVSNLAAVRFV